MENPPLEDVFPYQDGDFPLLCLFTGGYIYKFIKFTNRTKKYPTSPLKASFFSISSKPTRLAAGKQVGEGIPHTRKVHVLHIHACAGYRRGSRHFCWTCQSTEKADYVSFHYWFSCCFIPHLCLALKKTLLEVYHRNPLKCDITLAFCFAYITLYACIYIYYMYVLHHIYIYIYIYTLHDISFIHYIYLSAYKHDMCFLPYLYLVVPKTTALWRPLPPWPGVYQLEADAHGGGGRVWSWCS